MAISPTWSSRPFTARFSPVGLWPKEAMGDHNKSGFSTQGRKEKKEGKEGISCSSLGKRGEGCRKEEPEKAAAKQNQSKTPLEDFLQRARLNKERHFSSPLFPCPFRLPKICQSCIGRDLIGRYKLLAGEEEEPHTPIYREKGSILSLWRGNNGKGGGEGRRVHSRFSSSSFAAVA